MLPQELREYLGFLGHVLFSPVLVSFMQHFVNEYLQTATTLEPRVDLDLAVRPPQPLGLMPTQFALYDYWQFWLAHLMMR